MAGCRDTYRYSAPTGEILSLTKQPTRKATAQASPKLQMVLRVHGRLPEARTGRNKPGTKDNVLRESVYVRVRVRQSCPVLTDVGWWVLWLGERVGGLMTVKLYALTWQGEHECRHMKSEVSSAHGWCISQCV